MDLRALCREIIADESEAGREASLAKLYGELDGLEGYRRRTLGKTKYGPVYLFEEAERKDGKDVLLLGGLHPFCEAATAVSVLHVMREKHDYNLHAVPVLSPWAFVAPVNMKKLGYYDGDLKSKIGQYRDVNYHDMIDLEQVGEIALSGSARDMERLTKISGDGFDLTVECHMDYDRGFMGIGGTYTPTNRVGLILCSVSQRDYSALLKSITALHPLNGEPEIKGSRNDFLLNDDGVAAVLETDPDDITLVKRFTDVIVRHI